MCSENICRWAKWKIPAMPRASLTLPDAPVSAAVSCKNFDNSQQQKKWDKRKLKIFYFLKFPFIFEIFLRRHCRCRISYNFRIRRNSNVFRGTKYFMWGGAEKDRSIFFLKKRNGERRKTGDKFLWVGGGKVWAVSNDRVRERKVLYFWKKFITKNQLTKKIGTENFHFR